MRNTYMERERERERERSPTHRGWMWQWWGCCRMGQAWACCCGWGWSLSAASSDIKNNYISCSVILSIPVAEGTKFAYLIASGTVEHWWDLGVSQFWTFRASRKCTSSEMAGRNPECVSIWWTESAFLGILWISFVVSSNASLCSWIIACYHGDKLVCS